jgi:hypothetical protein
MKDKHDLARGWLAKAASDPATADLILDSPKLPRLTLPWLLTMPWQFATILSFGLIRV